MEKLKMAAKTVKTFVFIVVFLSKISGEKPLNCRLADSLPKLSEVSLQKRDGMRLSEIAREQLQELAAVIAQLSEADFTTALPLLDQATLGKHVRHTLEFHQCFLTREQSFCYDDRMRNPLLEQAPEEALKHIDWLMDRLRFVQLDRIISMEVRYGTARFEVTTSVQRELAFLIEHTVHHNAILRMALCASFPHIRFEPEFGYADSTIRFLEQSKTAI